MISVKIFRLESFVLSIETPTIIAGNGPKFGRKLNLHKMHFSEGYLFFVELFNNLDNFQIQRATIV